MWVGKPQKNDIKVLLCTLHTILWPGNTWKVLSMAELMDNSAVKKYHKKAIFMVHPDKLQNETDPEKKYIANNVFAAITEAWNEFKIMNNIN